MIVRENPSLLAALPQIPNRDGESVQLPVAGLHDAQPVPARPLVHRLAVWADNQHENCRCGSVNFIVPKKQHQRSPSKGTFSDGVSDFSGAIGFVEVYAEMLPNLDEQVPSRHEAKIIAEAVKPRRVDRTEGRRRRR